MNASLPTLPVSKGFTRLRKTHDQGDRVALLNGSVWVRDLGPEEVLEVAVVEGFVWVTQEADEEDHLLSSGERMTFMGPGKLVMEALEGAAECLIENHFI